MSGDNDDAIIKQLEDHERFLQRVANGVAEENAALEIGWTLAQLRHKMGDTDFRDMVEGARAQADGNVQQALYNRAITGNVTAQQFWLLNRQRHRWQDIKKIEVRTEEGVNPATVRTAVEVARQLLQESGPAAIQSFHAKAIETHGSES